MATDFGISTYCPPPDHTLLHIGQGKDIVSSEHVKVAASETKGLRTFVSDCIYKYSK